MRSNKWKPRSPGPKKSDLLHNLFREEAKECCFQNITERDPITIDRYEGAVAMLQKEISFAIEARRNQEIGGMHHFEQFVGDEGTHEE
jgi:hypothetical protein